MTVEPWMLLTLCPLIFAASFIDAIAGGGGLISLPAYYLIGLPPHLAAGTNKFSACMGTLVATGRYLRGGGVRFEAALPAAAAALPAAYVGARLLLLVPVDAVRIIVLIMIPLAGVFVLYARRDGARDMPERRAPLLSALIGLGVGLYDGFFGPGTGTFLMILFMGVNRLPAVAAAGSARVVNLASNAASLVAFVMGGQVLYAVALPAALSGILGAYLGSRLALKRGVAVIRPALIVVLALLLVKIAYDFIVGV